MHPPRGSRGGRAGRDSREHLAARSLPALTHISIESFRLFSVQLSRMSTAPKQVLKCLLRLANELPEGTLTLRKPSIQSPDPTYVKHDPHKLVQKLFPKHKLVHKHASKLKDPSQLTTQELKQIIKQVGAESRNSTIALDEALSAFRTLNEQLALMRRSSYTTTCLDDDVRVRVEASSFFNGLANGGARIFSYRIRLHNEGRTAVRLLGRHWVIREKLESDPMSFTMEVPKGSPGVVGHFPVLEPEGPRKTFEYVSGTLLERAPSGCIEGSFQMMASEDDRTFDAMVGRFALISQG